MKASDLLEKVDNPLVSYLAEESLKALLSNYSFFSFGPLKWLVSKLLFRIFTNLVEQGKIAVNFLEIDYEVNKGLEEYQKAKEKIKEPGISPEEKRKREEDAIAKAREFLRIGRK